MFPCPRSTDPRPTRVGYKVAMVEATRHDVLRREFNRWAEAGRGEQMEQEHLPIVLPVLDRMRLLRESFRVLREGGSAWVLMNYYGDNPHSHHWSEILSVPAHLMSSGRWAELFCEAGFTDVVHECIPDPTPVPEGYNGRWFQDVSQLRAFREFGSLLVQGVKPRL